MNLVLSLYGSAAIVSIILSSVTAAVGVVPPSTPSLNSDRSGLGDSSSTTSSALGFFSSSSTTGTSSIVSNSFLSPLSGISS